MTKGDDFPRDIGNSWCIKSREYHLRKPMLMGILNVTPDSFSDGGLFQDTQKAYDHALKMIDEGADIIDVGGESTRPGSKGVTTDEEVNRIIPLIEKLAKNTKTLISVDTQKVEVARIALEAGASIINDISAGEYESGMLELVAKSKAGYVVMHMQGIPETMQNAPLYQNIITDLKEYFSDKLKAASAMGIELSQIVLDPGIGFGKTLHNNLDILANMRELSSLGRPLLLGASRKSFIGMIDASAPSKRLGGSLAAVMAAYLQNIDLFRVHDVGETKQLIDIFTAIQKHSV
ncbi:MAG: dihydropteroate synthase [Candidatus Marinimicrobia bacterium]|nr:dihydropteroate synthase [Candidatus Neomarinimicrobiota bacterium]